MAFSRLGWEETTPFETNEIKPQDKVKDKAGNHQSPLDSSAESFLSIDQPNVVLLTWKRAEDDRGTIMRFVEVGGRSSTVNVASPILKFQSGWLCDAMEKDKAPLSVSSHGFNFIVKPFQIVTVRLEGLPVFQAR